MLVGEENTAWGPWYYCYVVSFVSDSMAEEIQLPLIIMVFVFV